MPRHGAPSALKSLVDVFSDVPDPRIARTRAHPIENVLTMALLGILSGAEGWDDLSEFAKHKLDVFAQFLDMTPGVPSADTFRRVFEALPPAAFQAAFRRWMEPLLTNLEGQTVALDGKALRGAMAHARGKTGAFHLLHVWATEHRILLGQIAVEGAGGEVPGALELLRVLDIKGATITADANHCASEITRTIRDGGAHYVLALKGNRGALFKHVEQRFADARDQGFPDAPANSERTEGHGRTEVRTVRAMLIGKLPPNIAAPWADLKTIVQVERIRVADTFSFGRSYYITSHPPQAAKIAKRIRDHWRIENELHHSLDVTFGDDRRKIRSEYGAQNFALVSRFALSLLKRHPGPAGRSKLSLRRKKNIALWSSSYFLEVLSAGFHEI